MNKAIISVLMTTFNHEQFIGETIESVLTSTYLYFELIVVDDASTDNTFEGGSSFAHHE
jgi:glycosyltransferase involved in cell wall biosynthesis